MRIRPIVISVALVSGLAGVPFSTATAQYYAPCSPFPLAWPFCVAGAIVGTAATIATAPFWALSGIPPYGYYVPPYYAAPTYYAPAYFAPPAALSAHPAPEAPAPLTPQPPTTHSSASHPSPASSDAYYFCPASKGYYPYVASCAVAWQSVPITPPLRSARR